MAVQPGEAGMESLGSEDCSQAGLLPPFSSNVAAQTEVRWPGMSVVRKSEKKTLEKTVEARLIFSGSFRRSRRLLDCVTRSCNTAAKAPMSGLVTGLPLPFPGLPMPGSIPFTSYPLSLELDRLGLAGEELVGGEEEIMVGQGKGQFPHDDSG